LEEFLHHRAVGERRPAGEGEKDRTAERIEVAAHVGRPRVAGLFGGNVVERAERHTARSEVVAGLDLMQPGKPHVDEPSPPGGGDDDVGGLDVAVHHLALGRMLQRIGHLDRHVDRPGHVERPPLADEIPKVRALDELEHDEVPAVLRAHRMHAADVFVVESGRRLGLVAKPPEHLLVGRLLSRQDFYGDDAIEGGVVGAKHGPHPAPAHEALELVGSEPPSFQHTTDLGHRERPNRRLCRDHGRLGTRGLAAADGIRSDAIEGRAVSRRSHGCDPTTLRRARSIAKPPCPPSPRRRSRPPQAPAACCLVHEISSGRIGRAENSFRAASAC